MNVTRTPPPDKPDEYEGLSPTFADACRKADEEYRRQNPRKKRTVIDDILAARSDSAAYQIAFHNRGNAVAASTLMAAEYLARQGDGKRFKTWLSEHSPKEQAAIVAHLKTRSGRKP